MIDFRGRRSAALMERLGSLVWIEDGAWRTSDVAATQAIIDAWQIADAQSARIAEIEALACSKRNAVVSDISPAEMASWPIKRAEALTWPGAAPMLSAEAAARGVEVGAIVERVLANAAALSGLEAAIAGTAGRHKDAVRALTDFLAIASYDIESGWPE